MRPGQMSACEIDVVRAWIAAAKAFDADALVATAHEDFEWAGMRREIQRGNDALKAWVERQTYGVAMHVNAVPYAQRGDTVVAEGCAEWRDSYTGELVETERGALVFVIREGKVARLSVHPDLTAGLSAGGLSEADAFDPRAA